MYPSAQPKTATALPVFWLLPHMAELIDKCLGALAGPTPDNLSDRPRAGGDRARTAKEDCERAPVICQNMARGSDRTLPNLGVACFLRK